MPDAIIVESFKQIIPVGDRAQSNDAQRYGGSYTIKGPQFGASSSIEIYTRCSSFL
jgi:hypothetical protein